MNLHTFLEEFKNGFKNDQGEYSEVFINPSMKEMDKIGSPVKTKIYTSRGKGEHLRFIATNNKKLYVFPSTTLHHEVVKKLNIPTYPNAFEGIAEKQGGIWKLVESHDLQLLDQYIGTSQNIKEIKQFLSQDWNWINKWIKINPYWNKLLKDIGRYHGFKGITKKLIIEEWKTSFKHPYEKNTTVEVFKNPTNKEILSVAREIAGKKYFRFIANSKTKSIYVFTPSMVHARVNKQLKNNQEDYPEKYEIWGVAQKSAGKWKAVTSDMLEFTKGAKVEILKQDWDWLKKWVDISPLIKLIRGGVLTFASNLTPKKFEKGKKVNEEFKGGFKMAGRYTEIFLDPSVTDMINVSKTIHRSKYIRFIADKKASYLYVFSPEIFHSDAADYIKSENMKPFDKKTIDQLWGTAKYVKGKWIFDGSDKPVPDNFDWNNLIKKKIFKNEEIQFERKTILNFDGLWSTKKSVHPDDYSDEKDKD